LLFLIQSPANFHNSGEMTDADKVMNPQHSGNDPADIRIRRLTWKIWIQMPDHFWQRFELSKHSLVTTAVQTFNAAGNVESSTSET